MPPELRIVLKEIKPVERSGSKTAATAMALERERIEAVLPKGVRIIALDERGKDLTSVGLSQQLMTWQQDGRDTAFLIGGADGLDPRTQGACRRHDPHFQHDAAARHGARDAGRAAVPGLVDHAEPSLSPRLTSVLP